jgi:hypothetical protein
MGGKINPKTKYKTFIVKFHISGASGLKSGQFDRKRNSGMTNVECRLIRLRRIELRNSLFYLLKKAERSDIHHSSIVNRHSIKFHTNFQINRFTENAANETSGFRPMAREAAKRPTMGDS